MLQKKTETMKVSPRFCARLIFYPLFFVMLYPFIEKAVYALDQYNGFTVNQPLVPLDEIHHGGPPRDGIPSLDQPAFLRADEVKQLRPDDRVLGLYFQGIARAYPIRILNYHEIVNDNFNDIPVLISFCPLCNTGMAFDAEVRNRQLEFGVSGLLYNSDVLMYDRQTNSLWSQIRRQAISGELKGEKLKMLPVEHVTWDEWRQRFPETMVLSFDTGHRRDYETTPYTGYADSDSIYFPVANEDKRYHPKEIVLGVEISGQYKAYPFSELVKTTSPIVDVVNGKEIHIHFNAEDRSGRVVTRSGKFYPVLSAFWFAWIAFHPDTDLFQVSVE